MLDLLYGKNINTFVAWRLLGCHCPGDFTHTTMHRGQLAEETIWILAGRNIDKKHCRYGVSGAPQAVHKLSVRLGEGTR